MFSTGNCLMNNSCCRYIGETKFAPGEWAGVELDESQGLLRFVLISNSNNFYRFFVLCYRELFLRLFLSFGIRSKTRKLKKYDLKSCKK
jgi:hypothetical protein